MTILAGISDSMAAAGRFDLPAALELRWSCTAAVCAAALGLDRRCAGVHERVDFTIKLTVLDWHHSVIEARFDSPREAQPILIRQPASCELAAHGQMLHIDVSLAGRRVLALSLGRDGRLVYVASSLLADAGLRGGTYDPPTVISVPPSNQTILSVTAGLRRVAE